MKQFLRNTILLLCALPLACYGQTGNIYTFAGTGTAGFGGDGGPVLSAQFNNPTDIFEDAAGNFYIADNGNNRVRKINTAGIITTIAGTGTAGYSGDGGPATSAKLKSPNRVYVDDAGNVYIADDGNNVVRKINTAGIISTIAGTGTAGFSGDGGPATSAKLSDPTAVAVDHSGNIFISDRGNSRIRKINTSGTISTYAGGGATAFSVDGVSATSVSLCQLFYVSVDNVGNVYMSNHGCYHFLKVTPAGLMYNVAGFTNPSYSGDCGPADSADIRLPTGICPDNMGNIYLCPQGNIRVRRVNSLNYITTVAGNGVAGYTGDGGPATSATISSGIYGIYADLNGKVYFADGGNNVIRAFTTTAYTDTIPLCPGNVYTLHDSLNSGTWSSSDTTVATVNATTGLLTAIRGGHANIAFNNVACPQLFYVVVFPPVIGTDTICTGSVLNLGDSSGSTWASSDTLVATVGLTTGIVNGLTPGIAIMTETLPGGCLVIDTITVEAIDTTYYVTDTAGCIINNTLILSIPMPYATYAWGNGSAAPAITVHTSGQYTDMARLGCNVRIDTFNVIFKPVPPVVLGNDTNICAGQSVTLSAGAVPGNTYMWSTGSAASAITVGATGTYWEWVSNGECVNTDTIIVTVYPYPLVNLGNDTLLCEGTPFTLQSSDTYVNAKYLWSTGDTTATISPAPGGIFWLKVTVAVCATIDTVAVYFTFPPQVMLGNDTTICSGRYLTLYANVSPGCTWLWSTGSTAPMITVGSAGSYWLQANNGVCTNTDTIHVAVAPYPVVDLGNDTAVCDGTPLTLQSSVAYTNPLYVWSNGSVTASIQPKISGAYWLQVNVDGCATTDTIAILFNPIPQVSLGNDTAICTGQVITLGSQSTIGTYLWSDGSTGATLQVSDGGIYALTVTQNGCSGSDTIQLKQMSLPVVHLVGDTTLCEGDMLLLDAGSEATVWSTGITAPDITITNTGTYWATVTNICGATTDTAHIAFEPCYVFFPNAFTPNGDGKNDVAKLGGAFSFYKDYYLAIYNRYGQMIYATYDIFSGWDGKFNGVAQDVGTYYYQVRYTFEGKSHTMKGGLLLIR